MIKSQRQFMHGSNIYESDIIIDQLILQTMYVLQKDILQFLGQNERFQIESGL